MSGRAITRRVADLGEIIRIRGLSSHDLRHIWATHVARNATPVDRLRDAGGRSSPAMPLRYVETAILAYENVVFSL
jgi:integrase